MKIEFTYIGNVPKDFSFKYSNKVEPLSGLELAKQVKSYLCYSIYKRAFWNHHIEAAQCSLPIMYINSGGITEYCQDFGIMFDIENFEKKF